MAFGIIHHFPGGTEANYRASIAAVHPSPDTLPARPNAWIATAVGSTNAPISGVKPAGSFSSSDSGKRKNSWATPGAWNPITLRSSQM